VPRHSPLHASPPLPNRSPLANTQVSPNYPSAPTPVVAPSPSLPIIGLDDGPPEIELGNSEVRSKIYSLLKQLKNIHMMPF